MFDLVVWILIILGIILLALFVIAAALRTVVPPNRSHVVIQGKKMRVFCPHPDYNKTSGGQSTYYKIPSWFPLYGMKVRILDLEMLEIKVPNFVAFDEGRARFECDIVAFVVVKDPVRASMRMPSIKEMTGQVSQILQATTRESTTKKTVRQTINDRAGIIKMIRPIFTEAVEDWGLALKDIELVEFKDAPKSQVISDLSSIKEKEINTEMREKNADQDMKARVKEAETRETAQIREIQQEEVVAKREQEKNKLVFAKEKEAKEQELEVVKVEMVKTQKIEKEQQEVLAEQEKMVALIEANKLKDVEEINKEQKLLDGEGDKVRLQQIAIGEASPIRETGTAEADVIKLKYEAEAKKAEPVREVGLAEGDAIKAKLVGEAKGKDELQKVYDRFTPEAIRAYVAKEIVDKDKAIGIALAKAFESADIKILSGGDKGSFDLSRIVESINVGSPQTANAIKNKLARPNDLGFEDIGALIGVLEKIKEKQEKQKYNDGAELGILDDISSSDDSETVKSYDTTKEEKPKKYKRKRRI